MNLKIAKISLGIRGRLTIWFAFGAVGILLVTAYVVYVTGLASIQGTLGQTYCQIASRVSDQFEIHFNQKTSLIRNIAIDFLTTESLVENNQLYRNRPDQWTKVRQSRLSSEWRDQTDPRRRKALLHPQLSQRLTVLAGLDGDLIKNYSVYDARGVLLGSTSTAGDRIVTDQAWFRKVRNKETHFTFLDLDASQDVLKVVVPVWGGIAIVGFVYAELDFNVFSHDITSLQFGQTGEAVAVDYAGVPLLGLPQTYLIAALSRKNLAHVVPTESSSPGSEPYWVSLTDSSTGLWDRLVCVAPIALLNTLRESFSLPPWSVVVTQSPEESYAALRNSLGSFAVAGFFGVILVGFAGGLLAWTMTQPIRDLRQGVRQFAGGNREHSVKVSGGDEIGELAMEFNRMAQRVSESENELRSFGQAVEDAADAIMLTGPDNVIFYVNPSFRRITGYSSNEAVGQTPAMLRSDKTAPEIHRQMWKSISEGHPWRGEVWNKRRNGEIYPAEMTISPVHDESGMIVSYIGIQRDITRASAYREQLEEEIDARTREIAETRALAVLGRMASMIAHDLRNALSMIKMNLQILHRRHDKADDPEREHCQIGLDQVRYMEEFLSDMLGYARPEKIQSDWHDIGQIFDDSLAAMGHILQGGDIEIERHVADRLPKVYCDRFKIMAVLRNLLENSIYAMPQGGVLTIIAEMPKITPGSPEPLVRIEIADTGTGIPEDVLEEVMEPFFTTRTKGTGLGLAIVKSIIARHGGETTLRSNVGEGTRVSFTLPTTADND